MRLREMHSSHGNQVWHLLSRFGDRGSRGLDFGLLPSDHHELSLGQAGIGLTEGEKVGIPKVVIHKSKKF